MVSNGAASVPACGHRSVRLSYIQPQRAKLQEDSETEDVGLFFLNHHLHLHHDAKSHVAGMWRKVTLANPISSWPKQHISQSLRVAQYRNEEVQKTYLMDTSSLPEELAAALTVTLPCTRRSSYRCPPMALGRSTLARRLSRCTPATGGGREESGYARHIPVARTTSSFQDFAFKASLPAICTPNNK